MSNKVYKGRNYRDKLNCKNKRFRFHRHWINYSSGRKTKSKLITNYNEIYFGIEYNLHDSTDAISNSCIIVDEIFRDVEDELVRY